MSRLDTFHAIRYRGIDGLRLDRLGRVNLITGPNGVGKTSLAEAVWLFNGRFTPVLPWNPIVQRSTYTAVDPLAALSAGVVELAGTERSVAHRWKARFETTPTTGPTGVGAAPGSGSPRSEGPGAEAQPLPVPVRGQLRVWFDEVERESDVPTQMEGEGVILIPKVAPAADHAAAVILLPASPAEVGKQTINRFSELVAQGRKEELKRTLRVILPLLADVEVITNRNGQPYILATTTASERLPLPALGGGMTRLFRLFVAFHEVRGGLVIVDEIENGLHHRVLPELWRRVQVMTDEFDVQLFATTHSGECVAAACDAFADRADEIAVHVLHRADDDRRVHAATYTGETLQAARDLDLDVR